MKQYGVLLCPHPNSRYEQSAKQLARVELTLLTQKAGISCEIIDQSMNGLSLLTFWSDDLTEEQSQVLNRMSNLFALFLIDQDEKLTPVFVQEKNLFSDLPSILKYKGKTNEVFTRFLINIASACATIPLEKQNDLLDPMCGKATTLFSAWGLMMNTFGIELDRKEIHEATTFLKQYLQHEKIKFTMNRSSRTLPKGTANEVSFVLKTPALSHTERTDFDGQSMQIYQGDARFVQPMLGKQKVDLIVADLPYGIAHSNGVSKKGKDTLLLLEKQLNSWHSVMRSGGAMVLSFNAYTLKREELRMICSNAGFDVQVDGVFDQMEHWVEQAVLRDVIVAKKV